MKPDFWRNRRVFVTGHTGFKGAWLCKWLVQMGAVVTGYARQPDPSSHLFELSGLESEIFSQTGDVQDLRLLSQVLNDAQPEVVFHLAAQALVRDSYKSPVETYATNVLGTVHLLEAVRGCPSVKAVVNVTTDKCYENREWVWGYREDEPMGGFDPYSSSKGCAELVTAAYRNSFFNSSSHSEHQVYLATARAGNVIGGGDWAEDRLIPDIIRAIESGQSVSIRNPNSTRPWQHVLEPLSGYLTLAKALYSQGHKFAEAFNFGPVDEDAKSVQWIVDQFAHQWGNGASWHQEGGTHPHEANYLKLDCSKARALLGWSPRWNLGQALQAIITWHQVYSAQHNKQDMRNICLKQINDYSSTI
jgi:CDP-glucose 4,6-dehydratase